MQTSLQGITKKAKEDKKYRFYDLYRMINRKSLMDTWNDINRDVASGVDKVTAGEYEQNLTENIINLEKRLIETRYKAKLVSSSTSLKSNCSLYEVRLKKFGLELSKEKTKVISFSRFKKEERTSFDFSGFEFRWGVSRNGNDIFKNRTARKKFKLGLSKFTEWIKRH